jgi:hypothetical protein
VGVVQNKWILIMKTNKENTLITDWLETYGDKKIEEYVEYKLFKSTIVDMVKNTPNDIQLGNKIRKFVENYSK